MGGGLAIALFGTGIIARFVRGQQRRMDGDTFNGRLLSDGRILWSDGAMWQRKVQPGPTSCICEFYMQDVSMSMCVGVWVWLCNASFVVGACKHLSGTRWPGSFAHN